MAAHNDAETTVPATATSPGAAAATTAAATAADALTANAYMLARSQRLLANKAFLASLGLGEAPAREAAPKRPRVKKEPQEPSRRSLRARGLSPDGEPIENNDDDDDDGGGDDDDDDDDVDLAMDVVMAAKIARLKALHEEAGTLPKNPTATYEHTWMRVKTMSDKALSTRVKVIEKAKGQHCIVKMQMFTEVLALAGKQELADEAKEALQRLCTLVEA